jgi:hypothetical protein
LFIAMVVLMLLSLATGRYPVGFLDVVKVVARSGKGVDTGLIDAGRRLS